jgi:hypothetical protein
VSAPEDSRFWLGKQKAGNTLTIKQTMTVFCAWLHCERVVTRASEITGVNRRTVSALVNRGNTVRGVPSFGELARMYEASGLLYMPIAHDESLKNYKWSRRKAVAQTLQICEGLRQQIRDVVLSGELKIKTPEDAAKMAQAVKSLEESMTKVAKQLDLVEGEAPEPKRASREPGPDNMKSKSVEELRAITGVVSIEKGAA